MTLRNYRPGALVVHPCPNCNDDVHDDELLCRDCRRCSLGFPHCWGVPWSKPTAKCGVITTTAVELREAS